MVDADDRSPDRSGSNGGEGHARTAAEFDDAVGRLHVEQLHRPAAARRRYTLSAVRDVGLILLFHEIGFSLTEIERFLAGERESRRDMIDHKLAELAEQQSRIAVARAALEHGVRCPAGDPLQCSRFWSIIEGRLGA